MPTVAFRVRSTRIKDIELSNNATIRDLKNILAANGYDVNEATRVRVIRQDGIVIGQMNDYALRDADCVEIDTAIIGPFNALAEREKRDEAECKRQQQINCALGKSTCAAKAAHKTPRIQISRIGDLGIAISIVED